MNNPSLVSLFGFHFINLPSEKEAADYILKNWENGEGRWPVVCTPNAYQITAFDTLPNLKSFFQNSKFVLADGQPIVWLSKLKKRPLNTRITGSGIFPIMWKMLIDQKEKVLLVVPNGNISEIMRKEFPECIFETAPFFNNKAEIETWSNTLETKIKTNKIKYVFLGLGFPKQEWLTYFLLNRNPDSLTLFLLFGASFEFYCGLKKRAPESWKNWHLEWLFRFFQEPSRLWKRYTIGNFIFLIKFLKEWMKK